jgi:3-dehydroquinate dehydratase-1
MGAKIVISHHDFLETPSSEEIQQLLEEMESTKADIVKLAVMPNAKDDVKRLLGETLSFHIRYPDRLLITISMGELGKISRTEGERVGSCVTFGAGKNASAPGQIPYNLLRDLL